MDSFLISVIFLIFLVYGIGKGSNTVKRQNIMYCSVAQLVAQRYVFTLV